ncbi:6-hydroxymethylpterin diphosphokinase MptE-like protein [Clostridium sp.]|uniref:motility associated factor glycosyltransferase family protein n=1 Tax=Clostridium sp. TaxID=1506 RepID=UPI002609EECA|nr:6-hydroxymethylpterin diphosphokinase MptE-like protein [Clostridium sp.]
MVEIEKTKSGLFTMKYNNKYIHSKYNPIEEAQQLISANIEILNNPTIVVYGLGLGYHINSILEKMNSKSMIYVFEYNIDIIKYCKEINNNIFNHNNINIIGSNDKKFYEKLAECLGKAGDIIIHRSSLETIKSDNESLYNLIDDFSLVKQADEHNEKLKKLGKENFEVNTKQNYKLIDGFIDLYKDITKPYVVTSAGPSLDNELDLLREYREKFNIISVGTSLRALMEKEIKPDAIVILDGSELVKKQLEGYSNENIPLCFCAKASRWAVSYYKGPKYIFNVSEYDKFIISTEETVAVSAIDIAIKCEAKEIIFLGQDLAFTGDKSHTETFEKIYGIKNNGVNNNKIRTIKGVDGGLVNTAQGYIRFKIKIERLMRSNSHVKFVNCSKGAFIEGAKHIEFKDYCKLN